jgi:hypothetical protein
MRTLLIVPALWLFLSGFGGLGGVSGTAMLGALPGLESKRPRPFVRPDEILFGQATNPAGLEWRILQVTPTQRALYLARIRAGHEATDDLSPVFAVARSSSGRFFYVFREDVLW